MIDFVLKKIVENLLLLRPEGKAERVLRKFATPKTHLPTFSMEII